MAKDPAFLFYPGDWLGGTMTFTRSHKGAYMDLLMVQFNSGHMELQDIQMVLGSDFETMWEQKLKPKFATDSEGRYYNEKLETEINKRKKFTQSRKENLVSSKKSTPHMGTHMQSHMENESENENTLTSVVLSSQENFSVFSLNHEELKKDFLNSDSWIFTLIRNNPKLNNPETVKKHMVDFCRILSDANQYPITFREASNRFSGYLLKQINGKSQDIQERKSTQKIPTL